MHGGLRCNMLSYLMKAEERGLINREAGRFVGSHWNRCCWFLAFCPFLLGNRTTFYPLEKMSPPPAPW